MVDVLKQKMDEDEAKSIVDTIDIDDNNKIYWYEFLSSVLSHSIMYREENIKEVFSIFDKDKKGYFDATDVKNAFEARELPILDQDLEFLLK